jgi:hypothetical protein
MERSAIRKLCSRISFARDARYEAIVRDMAASPPSVPDGAKRNPGDELPHFACAPCGYEGAFFSGRCHGAICPA